MSTSGDAHVNLHNSFRQDYEICLLLCVHARRPVLEVTKRNSTKLDDTKQNDTKLDDTKPGITKPDDPSLKIPSLKTQA